MAVGTAGLLVTAYALGISIGGPLLTVVTLRVDRRLMLLVALAAYVVGNLLAIAATGFGVLVLARALTGSLHRLLIGVASTRVEGLDGSRRPIRATEGRIRATTKQGAGGAGP